MDTDLLAPILESLRDDGISGAELALAKDLVLRTTDVFWGSDTLNLVRLGLFNQFNIDGFSWSENRRKHQLDAGTLIKAHCDKETYTRFLRNGRNKEGD